MIGVGQDSCDNTHPNFDQILEEASCGNPDVLDLFDVEQTVAKKFDKLSERISVAYGGVYLDGDAVDSAITDQIVAFLNAGVEDWRPLVKFMDKVQANPNEHSRDQLYNWMRADSTLTITADGNIIGYKGVNGNLTSVRGGPGIVNGQETNGHLDNSVGNVIEMARSKVQHDPSQGCSVGLHVGTYDYAVSWAQGAVLKVLVDPRDVVSVPTDCSAQKMRVCRYTVLDAITVRCTAPIDDYDEDEFPEDDEPECPECDDGADDCNCW